MNDSYNDFDELDAYDNVDELDTFAVQEKPSVEATAEALRSGETGGVPSSDVFYGLSGLTSAEIAQVIPVWTSLSDSYRAKIMQVLAEASETNFELDYRSFGLYGLTDPSPAVREAAIDTLWEDESIEVMNRLMDLATSDPATNVRAAAASKLGRFILMGELGDFPEPEARKAQDTVIRLLKDTQEDVNVRRRALEAISNCGHEIVPSEITRAYHSDDRRMQVSAVYAMGRTCDSRWAETVLEEISSSDAEMRFEAARASGELELTRAVPALSRLVIDDDREIRETAIWALGEIGGKEAMRVLSAALEAAEEEEDDDLIEVIEDAIANANLVGGDLFGTLGLDD